jgi:hypothetical protein
VVSASVPLFWQKLQDKGCHLACLHT